MSRTEAVVDRSTIMKNGVIYHKLTKELYIKHKKEDGWNDRRIMQRYGMHNNQMQEWKKANLTEKEMKELSLRKKTSIKNLGGYIAKKDKPSSSVEDKKHTAEEFEEQMRKIAEVEIEPKRMESMDALSYALESDWNNELLTPTNVEENTDLEKELENLKAACTDLENENSSLHRKLVENDYKITNYDYAFESLREDIETLSKENAALKELVRLWI